MPVPQFIVDLRKRIGQDLLWLLGLSAVVLHEDGQILLGRRSDTGKWAVISGIPEPGEEPSAAIEREILEETGVQARVRTLASVRTTPPIIHANGDRAQYLNLNFIADYRSGHAHVGDDESLEVGWFHPETLPEPMTASSLERIQDAVTYLNDPAGGALLTR